MRKSSFEGKAAERSISGFTSGSSFGLRLLFFHLLVVLFLRPGEGSGGVELCWRASPLLDKLSSVFFLFSRRFMVNLSTLVDILVRLRHDRGAAGLLCGSCNGKIDILCDVQKNGGSNVSSRVYVRSVIAGLRVRTRSARGKGVFAVFRLPV